MNVQEEIDSRMKTAQEASQRYVEAWIRKDEKCRNWEQHAISVAISHKEPIDSSLLWYKSLASGNGRDLLDLWRIAEVELIKAKNDYELALSTLEGQIAVSKPI